MEDLSALIATEKDPALYEAVGTEHSKYSPEIAGPFHCSVCEHWIAFRRCDHPDVLKDARSGKYDYLRMDEKDEHAVVDPGGCCEYERKRVGLLVELSEVLSKAEPRDASWNGIAIAVENEAGSVREGKRPDGSAWRTKLKRPYGFIKRTTGLDGEWLDCFVGPDKSSERVFVIRAMQPETGADDEDKVVLGAKDRTEAERIFLEHYDDSRYMGRVSEMPLDEFKKWLALQPGVQMSEVEGKPIAIDFDGTIAKRRKGKNWEEAGKPIPKTFALIAELRRRGFDPYVLTARSDLGDVKDYLKKCGMTIEVTNEKKPGTLAIVDDRAVDAEDNSFKDMLKLVLEKVELSQRSRPSRSYPTQFWDQPVHEHERRTNLRAIDSLTLRHETALADALNGALRLRTVRAYAKEAVKQLSHGKRPTQLAFEMPEGAEDWARPFVTDAYHEAKADAREEADRVALAMPMKMQERRTGTTTRADDAAVTAILIYLTDRYGNYLSSAVRDAVALNSEIVSEVEAGNFADARATIEVEVARLSPAKVGTLAQQVTRDAVRQGRSAALTSDPRLDGLVWVRSSVLEPSTCDPCRKADMTVIPGPDYDVSQICEGGDMCRCLPVAVVRDEVVR